MLVINNSPSCKPAHPFAINTLSQQANGLVLCWAFNYDNSRIIKDYSLYNNDAVCTTNLSTLYTSDVELGQCIKWNTTARSFTGKFGGKLTLRTGYTITGWVRPSSRLAGTVLASLNITGTTPRWRFAGAIDNTATITVNQLYHVAGVLEGNTAKLYVNGVLVRTRTLTYTSSQLNAVRTVASILGLGTSKRYVPGNHADIRFYNRALSNTEIEIIANPATRFDLYEPQTKYSIFPFVDNSAILSCESSVLAEGIRVQPAEFAADNVSEMCADLLEADGASLQSQSSITANGTVNYVLNADVHSTGTCSLDLSYYIPASLSCSSTMTGNGDVVSGNARITQLALEVFGSADPEVLTTRVGQFGVEICYSKPGPITRVGQYDVAYAFIKSKPVTFVSQFTVGYAFVKEKPITRVGQFVMAIAYKPLPPAADFSCFSETVVEFAVESHGESSFTSISEASCDFIVGNELLCDINSLSDCSVDTTVIRGVFISVESICENVVDFQVIKPVEIFATSLIDVAVDLEVVVPGTHNLEAEGLHSLADVSVEFQILRSVEFAADGISQISCGAVASYTLQADIFSESVILVDIEEQADQSGGTGLPVIESNFVINTVVGGNFVITMINNSNTVEGITLLVDGTFNVNMLRASEE